MIATLASVAAVVVLTGTIVRAQGITPCDPVIVDDAGVFTETSRVLDAASALERRGAIVRMRTIRTFGSAGSLDHYRAEIVRTCPSWRAPNGENRDNLFAILIAMDEHEVGIYTGVDWKRINDAHGVAIQADVMGPRLRSGDVTGAFVAAMEEFGRLLEASRPSAAAASGGTTIIHTTPAPPVDTAGSANVGFWLLGFLLFAFIVFVIAKVVQASGNRKAARAKASEQRHAATTTMLELRNGLGGLKTRMDAAVLSVAEQDAQRLRGMFQELDRGIGAAAVTIQEVEAGDGDPTRDGRTKQEYESVAVSYGRAMEQLRTARAKRDTIVQEVEALHAAAKAAPQAIDAAEAAIGSAGTVIAERRDGGWRVGDAEAALEGARETYLTALEHRDGKRLAAAKQSADEARKDAEAAKQNADGLPRRKADIDAFLRKLEQRLESMPSVTTSGRDAFDRISERYAEACVEPVEGNGSKAEVEIDEARVAIESGRTATTMEQQRWDDAETAAHEADAALDRAAGLLQAIHTLEDQLHVAEQSAAQEIAAATTDIDTATVYEQRHDADIDDDMKRQLHQARATLTQARALLEEAKPNFLEVVRLAQAANRHADEILAACQKEHEAAERLRKKAASAVRDADAAIAKARTYISSHSWNVSSAAERSLASARSFLQNARETVDPHLCIREAERATADAILAYEEARRDVAAADDGVDDAVAFVAGMALGQTASRQRAYRGGNGGGYRTSPSSPRAPAPSRSASSGRATTFGGSSGGKSSGRATKW